MGEARRIEGKVMKALDGLGIVNADRRFVARCTECPCAVGSDPLRCALMPNGMENRIDDPADVPPLACPLRQRALVLALDPEAR
jgi:hypothetical protein